ncbi:MAG: biotin/lipoyl-containing protein, partial [Thermoplasmatota archaeon]
LQGKIRVDGENYKVMMENEETVTVNGKDYRVSVLFPEGRPKSKSSADKGTSKRSPEPSGETTEVISPMLGTILRIPVSSGQKVKAGETIAILEAMKMENDISAPKEGTIKQIHVKKGEDVEEGALIATMV